MSSSKPLSAGVYFPRHMKPQQLYRKENINRPSSLGLSRLPVRRGHPLAGGGFVFGVVCLFCSVLFVHHVLLEVISGSTSWEFRDICRKNVHLDLKINFDRERRKVEVGETVQN